MLGGVATVNPEKTASSQPTRRERTRAATRAEILDAARRLLIEGGTERVTLRGIASELGMTAPALYRYFGSREALIGELCDHLYDELADVLVAARDKDLSVPLKQRFLVTSHSFRTWALDHRPEFGLLFGAPVPGVMIVDAHVPVPNADRGQRFGEVWLELFVELWRHNPVKLPPDREIDPRLREHLAGYWEQIGPILPIGAIVLYLSCWVQLYGAVATEAFGHLSFALAGGAADAMFDGLMKELATKLGLSHPA
jgi:AcrR family transcriptional regulator